MSIVETLILIALLALGLTVAARTLQRSVTAAAHRTGEAVMALQPLQGHSASAIALRAPQLRAAEGGPEPSPSPNPTPAPPKPDEADNPLSGAVNWFKEQWENGLWNEDNCEQFWSVDCASEFAKKGVLSSEWNKIKAVWDTGSSIVGDVVGTAQQWIDDPKSIVTGPIDNVKDCLGDLGACAKDYGADLLSSVWDDTSSQLAGERDIPGLVSRTGAKAALLVVGPGAVKTGLKFGLRIFRRGPDRDRDPDRDDPSSGGGGNGGSGDKGGSGGSGSGDSGGAGAFGPGGAGGSGGSGEAATNGGAESAEDAAAQARRYEDLSTERGTQTDKTRSEAASILQAEREGLVSGRARRPDPNLREVDHDFIMIDEKTGKPLHYVEIKTPIDPKLRRLDQQAEDIAGHIKLYDSDVVVVVDLKNLSADDKADFASALAGHGVTPGQHVKFLNS